MASEILRRLGVYIKDNNTYFNSVSVNGVQLPTGEVIEFTDGKEKRFIGISDNFGTAAYIRYNPNITHQTSDRRLTSGRTINGQIKQCRLVAYSWDPSITSESLMTKLILDLSRVIFSGEARTPVLTIKNGNHNYIDIITEEFRKESVGGFGFVCVAIDFDLKYWANECEIVCVDNAPVPYNGSSILDIISQGDAETLAAANEYTDQQIAEIPTPETIYDISSIRYSGKSYSFPFTGDVQLSSAFGTGALVCCPMPVGEPHTITSMSVFVNTGAAGKRIRLGIYEDDNGYPGDLIIDSGDIPCDVAGTKTFVFPTPIELTGKLIFPVIFNEGGSGSPEFQYITGVVRLLEITSSTISGGQIVYNPYPLFAFGVLPATFLAGVTSRVGWAVKIVFTKQ